MLMYLMSRHAYHARKTVLIATMYMEFAGFAKMGLILIIMILENVDLVKSTA